MLMSVRLDAFDRSKEMVNQIQIRSKGTDGETVRLYADNISQLPPIEVVDLGKEQRPYVVADGEHRYEAVVQWNTELRKAQKQGERKSEKLRSTIEAHVRKGTIADARLLSAKGNVAHGRPLTRDERAQAVMRSSEYLGAGATDTQVAELLGVSNAVVSRIRGVQAVRKLTVPAVVDHGPPSDEAALVPAGDGTPREREERFSDLSTELADSSIESVLPLLKRSGKGRKASEEVVAKVLAHGVDENWSRDDYRKATRLLKKHPDVFDKLMATRGAPPPMTPKGSIKWNETGEPKAEPASRGRGQSLAQRQAAFLAGLTSMVETWSEVGEVERLQLVSSWFEIDPAQRLLFNEMTESMFTWDADELKEKIDELTSNEPDEEPDESTDEAPEIVDDDEVIVDEEGAELSAEEQHEAAMAAALS